MFHRVEEGLNLTKALILVNIGAYVLCAVLSRNFITISSKVLILFGQFNVLVLNYGYWWQLFTAMFIHMNIAHLFLNMLWLFILGTQVERILGTFRYSLVYFLSGLFGNILTLFLMPPQTVSAGASGAVFGIFGFLIMYGGASRGKVFSALMYALLILMLNVGFGINVIAHFGGLLIGLILGYYYGRKTSMEIRF